METSADEVRETFLVTPEAEVAYYGWENDTRRAEVVRKMRDHTTRAIYDCRLEHFEWIKKNHTHPLGKINKEKIEHITLARDWYPRFAFVHLFHVLLEKLGRLPLWDEVNKFITNDPEGMRMLGAERTELKDRIFPGELETVIAKYPGCKDPENRANALAEASLNWRIGNAYYGFMREMYTVVALRALEVPVKVHPLADANFRTDGWVDEKILSVFVTNPTYKVAEEEERAMRHHQGRKKKVDKLFPNSEFSFVELTMERADHFGVFHFPKEAEIKRVSELLKGGGC
ncbi:hypothetical protein [Amycolatopsis sp. NBC_00438]|uniref:hypothetical protein n=1 Tax=Amycolatopsis sp. NBC_00438 TaxID=2903558 RepID=UPI002E1FA04A